MSSPITVLQGFEEQGEANPLLISPPFYRHSAITVLTMYTTGAIIDANAPLNDDLDNHGPVDSDEEKEAVMAAIARSHPQPLATRPLISTRSKYQFIRMKEMLHNALGGSRGAGLFSVASAPANEHQSAGGPGHGMFGGGTVAHGAGVGGEGVGGFDGHARRMSGVVSGTRQILPGQLPPPARKVSVPGQA